MEPQIPAFKKTCVTCYWFDFEPGHKPRTRSCCYPGPIRMDPSKVTISSPSGDQQIGKNICAMWKDCGLLEMGISKSMV